MTWKEFELKHPKAEIERIINANGMTIIQFREGAA
jgi:hypothetical protein